MERGQRIKVKGSEWYGVIVSVEVERRKVNVNPVIVYNCLMDDGKEMDFLHGEIRLV